MKKILTGIALFCAGILHAQTHTCATDFAHEHALENNAQYRSGIHGWENLFALAQNRPETSNTYTIPVVIHILHNDGPENISDAQIHDALRVLNEDFNRLNGDTSNTRSIFKPVAADSRIHFELAKKDPNGNCTNGIVRVRTSRTVNAFDDEKELSNWDNDRYLNIWVVHSIENFTGTTGTILGYAYYPAYNQFYAQDGVVIRHDVMGSIGTSATSGFNNGGRTLTHELGHYFGLPHTFAGGCFGGDGINDTPPATAPNYGCPLNANTCSNDSPDLIDQIENYMDYSNGFCQNMFSLGQRDVMHQSLDDYGLRGQLTDSINLIQTGITAPPTGGCIAQADFSTNKKVFCAGDSVLFIDRSWNADVVSRQWTFPGGTPATSTDSAVWITYANPGDYDATLTVTASGGSNSFTRSNIVFSIPQSGRNAIGYSESFEVPSTVADDFKLEYTDSNRTWNLNSQVAYTGSRSIYIRNYNKDRDQIESFYTPTYDFTSDNFASFTFKYAYARRNSNSEDELRVFASTNCGQTWIPRLFIPTSTLSTSNDRPFSEYVPNESDWKEATILLSPFNAQDNVIFKFEFTSGGGNNIYIDDLMMDSPLTIEEFESNIEVFPNPTDGSNIRIENTTGKPINRIKVMSFDGKEIMDFIPAEDFSNSATLSLPEDLVQGVYFIYLNIESFSIVKRLHKI
jgi:PKD repeat protein